MHKYKNDIIIACAIILILTYIIPAPKIIHYGVLAFLLLSGLPSLGRNEKDFYDNQIHDDEIEEVQNIDKEEKTDYSQLDSCFFNDNKKK